MVIRERTKMNLEITKVLSKNWLPTKYWEEILREAHEIRLNVKIGHIDPVPFGNQEFINPKTITESETHQTIIAGSERPPVIVKSERYQQGAEKMMEDYARATGGADLLRTVQKMKEQSRALKEKTERDFKLIASVSEKFDYHNFITIERHDNEDIAKQILENQCLIPTKGPLDVPIPGATIPGMSSKTTLRELFKTDMMKKYITKEQIEEIEKAAAEAEKNPPKNIKIQKGKYQGYDVVYASGKNTGRNQISGPSHIKESKDRDKLFHLVRVGCFVISGPLLQVLNSLLLGSTSCDSLTEFKTKTTVEKIGGQTFVTKEIYPVKSTLAKENYLYKEEVDKIFNSIFSIIKGR